MKNTHSHRFALPRWLSRSGESPSLAARTLFLILAPLLAVVALNAIVAASVEGVIYPGVTVAGTNVSGMTRQQAQNLLTSQTADRSLKIKVGDKTFQASHSELGAEYDIPATVELAYQVGRHHGLPLIGLIDSTQQTRLAYAYAVDYRQLQKFTTAVVSSVGRPAANAGVKIEGGQAVVVPDQPGLGLDQTTITRLVSNSLADAENVTFVLKPQTVQATIRTPEANTAKTESQQLVGRQVRLLYNGREFRPTPDDIGHWLTVVPENLPRPQRLIVTIEEQQVRGYIQSVANAINKNPVNKKILVANGVSSVDREGQDGLAVDQEVAVRQVVAAMRESTTGLKDITLQVSAVPFKTETVKTVSLDAPKYIEVNLSKQQAWAYEDGKVVLSTPITSGATGAGLGTATGLFAIYYKTTNTYLNGRPYGYNYNVFVKYWMPFYLGYGMHDASWRTSFGGADYYLGGSHGCVNMPDSAAAFIYNWAPVGTPVWVHY